MHSERSGSGRSRRAWLGLWGGALAWVASGCSQAAGGSDDARSVSLDTARAALGDGRVWLIDVREPDEHARGVAPGAKLLPMSQLAQRQAELPKDHAQPVLVICNSQNRSPRVVEALRTQGYTDVRYVQGGMSGWASRGWPMVPPAGR